MANDYETGAFKHVTTKKNYSDGRTEIKPAPEEVKGPARKKDTKKWCKGVPGREHKWSWVYMELVWHHRRGKEFTEPELHPHGWTDPRDVPGARTTHYVMRPWATMYCPVCQKQWKFRDAWDLKQAGIPILTALPVVCV